MHSEDDTSIFRAVCVVNINKIPYLFFFVTHTHTPPVNGDVTLAVLFSCINLWTNVINIQIYHTVLTTDFHMADRV